MFSVTSLTVPTRCLEGGTTNSIEVIQEGTRQSGSKRWTIEKVENWRKCCVTGEKLGVVHLKARRYSGWSLYF